MSLHGKKHATPRPWAQRGRLLIMPLVGWMDAGDVWRWMILSSVPCLMWWLLVCCTTYVKYKTTFIYLFWPPEWDPVSEVLAPTMQCNAWNRNLKLIGSPFSHCKLIGAELTGADLNLGGFARWAFPTATKCWLVAGLHGVFWSVGKGIFVSDFSFLVYSSSLALYPFFTGKRHEH